MKTAFFWEPFTYRLKLLASDAKKLRACLYTYIKDAPVEAELHIVPSSENPSGCGEPPVPVSSRAVVNALSRLTGRRRRRLPLTEI